MDWGRNIRNDRLEDGDQPRLQALLRLLISLDMIDVMNARWILAEYSRRST